VRETIQGEPSVGQATLSRFYAVHVVVLPLVVFALAALHLFSIQLHGMSRGIDGVVKRVERFFPSFMVKVMTLWRVVSMILFIAALCLPFESFFAFPLAQPYNPLGSTPEGIKPEWYFYFVYCPLEMLPFWIVMLAVNGGALVLLVAPWVFKGPSRRTL